MKLNLKVFAVGLAAVAGMLVFASTALTTGGSSSAGKFRAACLSLGTDHDRSWAQGNFAGCERAAKDLGVTFGSTATV